MIFTITMGTAAFVAALLSVLGLAIVLHVTALRQQGFISYFVPIILSLSALQTVALGRDLSAPGDLILSDQPLPVAVLVPMWLGSLILLMASTERIASFVVAGATGDRGGRGVSYALLLAFLAMWTTTELLPAILGGVPAFSHRFIYTVLLGCAALTVGQQEATRIVELARNATLLFLLASVLVISILPLERTIESPYLEGLIPGLPRLHGLASHAVTLGMLALFAGLCLAAQPLRGKLASLAAWALVLGTLLLAQSKVSWIGLVVCGIGVGLARGGPHVANLARNRRAASILVLVLCIATLGYITIGGLLTFGEIATKLGAFFASDTGANILSLTGRDLIWSVALEEWRRYPIFGYGPTLFDSSYRVSIGIAAAVHGHNQVIDTLARSGLVGVTGLAWYVAALTFYSFKYGLASRGLTVGLYLLLLLRAITEVPLSVDEYSPEMIPHIALLVTIAGLHSRRAKEPSRTSSHQQAGPVLQRVAVR